MPCVRRVRVWHSANCPGVRASGPGRWHALAISAASAGAGYVFPAGRGLRGMAARAWRWRHRMATGVPDSRMPGACVAVARTCWMAVSASAARRRAIIAS